MPSRRDNRAGRRSYGNVGTIYFFHAPYLVFTLAGIANVSFWTIGLAMTLEFGAPAERPVYISLANTLVAPSAIVAPLLGGWLADSAGYLAAFVSAIGGMIAVVVFHMLVQDVRYDQAAPVQEASLRPECKGQG